MNIVDVGAYLGIYSLTAAEINGSSQITAFEPNPTSFQKLVQNITLNKLENIVALENACGDAPSTSTLNVDKSRVGSSGATMAITEGLNFIGVTVEQVTLDSTLQNADLIKIDAEGWEINVLRGAIRILAQCKPTLFLEILSPAAFDEILMFLKPYGYSSTEFLGRRDEEPIQTNKWTGKGNYLFT